MGKQAVNKILSPDAFVKEMAETGFNLLPEEMFHYKGISTLETVEFLNGVYAKLGYNIYSQQLFEDHNIYEITVMKKYESN